MYEIYVIGSMQLMQSVLNAVASMTATGGVAGNGKMIALGLMFSILFVVTKAIVTQKLELQYFFISLVLYLAMFAPKVTVHLEDVTTGAVVNIANVPVGVAGIGSLASSVGTSLSKAYETLFSIPGITDGGYITPLKILAAARNPNLGNANTLGPVPSGGTTVNVTKSLNNYMIDCAYQDMYAELPGQDTTEANMKAATDATLWDSLKVNATSWFTVTYLTNGLPSGTLSTCSDAWADLDSALTTHAALSVDYMGKNNGDPTFTVTADNAITTLTGSAVTMQNFMRTTFVRNVAENAKAGFFVRAGDVAMSSMLTQAKTQRQIQWAAEKDMFEEVAKPLIAAIEAFFYAISPIMIFFVLLGSFGWGLFLKYIIMAIWIQLWMPILAVNNHYIMISVQEAFTNLAATGLNFTTHDGMNETWDTLATWTATGGMLAAATPLMALMVITGSFYAFTKLTDRMNGGDHVDEKQMAPDLQKTAPVVAMGPMQQNAAATNYSGGAGHTTPGFQIPSISYGSDSSHQVASARQEMAGASSRFDTSVGNALGNVASLSRGSDSRYGSSHDYSSSHSKADKVAYEFAKNVLSNSGATDQQINTLAGNVSMSMAGSEGGAGALRKSMLKMTKGFPVGGSMSQGFNLSEAITNQLNQRDGAGKTVGETIGNEYRDATRDDIQQGESSALTKLFSDGDRSDVSHAKTDLYNASKSFTDTLSSSDNRRSQVSLGLDTASQAAVNNPDFARGLSALIAEGGLNNQVDSNMVAVQGIGMENNQRVLASQIKTLDESSPEMVAKLDALIGQHVVGSGTTSTFGDAGANKGITAGRVDETGEAQSEVESRIPKQSTFKTRDDFGSAHEANKVNFENNHNEAVATAQAAESTTTIAADAEQRMQDDQEAIIKKDLESNGIFSQMVSQIRNPIDMARATFDQDGLASDFKQEALDAGFNEDAATYYGILAVNTIENGGFKEGTLNTYMGQEASALGENISPTIQEALRNTSLFDDDKRGNRLRSLSAMEGLGTR